MGPPTPEARSVLDLVMPHNITSRSASPAAIAASKEYAASTTPCLPRVPRDEVDETTTREHATTDGGTTVWTMPLLCCNAPSR